MKRVKSLLCFLFIASTLATIFFSSSIISAQSDEDIVDITIRVHVLDIDQHTRTAQIQILLQIEGLPYNETNVEVLVIDGGSTLIVCNNTGLITADKWRFSGDSEEITWLLSGTGEVFPFESYLLKFKIRHLSHIHVNSTALNSEESYSAFGGSQQYILTDFWAVDNKGYIPIQKISDNEAIFVIRRSIDSQIYNSLVILLPIILFYYLLGSTLLLKPESQLTERLTIYLAIIVIIPAFMISLNEFLPYRSSLSFPEFLLANLAIETALLGIASIVGKIKYNPTKKILLQLEGKKSIAPYNIYDRSALLLSMIFFLVTYLLTLISKIEFTTSFLLSFVIIPSYAYWRLFFVPKDQFTPKKLFTNPLFLFFFIGFIIYVIFTVFN